MDKELTPEQQEIVERLAEESVKELVKKHLKSENSLVGTMTKMMTEHEIKYVHERIDEVVERRYGKGVADGKHKD